MRAPYIFGIRVSHRRQYNLSMLMRHLQVGKSRGYKNKPLIASQFTATAARERADFHSGAVHSRVRAAHQGKAFDSWKWPGLRTLDVCGSSVFGPKTIYLHTLTHTQRVENYQGIESNLLHKLKSIYNVYCIFLFNWLLELKKYTGNIVI